MSSKPIWEGGMSRSEFHRRLAEWAAGQQPGPSVSIIDECDPAALERASAADVERLVSSAGPAFAAPCLGSGHPLRLNSTPDELARIDLISAEYRDLVNEFERRYEHLVSGPRWVELGGES